MVENDTTRRDESTSASTERDVERERLAAERAARREARLAALAPRPEPRPEPVAARAEEPGAPVASGPVRTETVQVVRRDTDRFAGALGLFLLRLATAAIVGVHGLFHLTNLPATTEMLQKTLVPAPGIAAIVLGAVEVGVAVALVFGLITRVAGLALALLSGATLAFVLWGPWSPFAPGQAGFTGELEVLLVAVGLLFLLLGAGGWSIDRGFRARRDRPRAD